MYLAPSDAFPSDAQVTMWVDLPVDSDQLIGTPLQRIIFRVLVAEYNVKIILRGKSIHFV